MTRSRRSAHETAPAATGDQERQGVAKWPHLGEEPTQNQGEANSPHLGEKKPVVKKRARSRRSAKDAGTKFERSIADALAQALADDRIDRRIRTGNRDRGDVAGVRLHGQRVVVECKDVARLDLPAWTREAQLEAGNDDALCGLVIHKRHGRGDPMQQWVSCTVADLVAILTGQRVEQ